MTRIVPKGGHVWVLLKDVLGCRGIARPEKGMYFLHKYHILFFFLSRFHPTITLYFTFSKCEEKPKRKLLDGECYKSSDCTKYPSVCIGAGIECPKYDGTFLPLPCTPKPGKPG